MLMVKVPDVMLGAPLVPPVAKKVTWYVPLLAEVGVSVTLHSSSYSSAVPEPEVAVVQAGELVRDVASAEPAGREPELTVIDDG
jgi:hypothetical protein